MNITIQKNDDIFLAVCHNIQGAMAEGRTRFEAFYNLVDVIRVIRELKKEPKQETTESISFDIPSFA